MRHSGPQRCVGRLALLSVIVLALGGRPAECRCPEISEASCCPADTHPAEAPNAERCIRCDETVGMRSAPVVAPMPALPVVAVLPSPTVLARVTVASPPVRIVSRPRVATSPRAPPTA